MIVWMFYSSQHPCEYTVMLTVARNANCCRALSTQYELTETATWSPHRFRLTRAS